jgi:hypothetical protein
MRRQMLMAVMISLLAMVSMAVVTGCYSKPKEEPKQATPAESAAPSAEPAAPPAESAPPPAQGGDAQ